MPKKYFDRLLNIALAGVVALWLAQKFLLPAPVALKDEAASAFGEASSPGGAPRSSAQPAAEPVASPAEHGDFAPLSLEEMESAAAVRGPVMFLVFASWCPYCERLIPELGALLAEEPELVTAIGLSVDRNAADLRAYVARQPGGDLPFPIHRQGNADAHAALGAFLEKHRLNTDGGLPHIVLFLNGEPVADLLGYLPPETLRAILREAHAKSVPGAEKASRNGERVPPGLKKDAANAG